MNIDFPLIKDAEIQWANLLAFEVGAGLLALGLWHTPSLARRVGGAAVLLAAILLALGWLTVNGLVAGTALGLV